MLLKSYNKEIFRPECNPSFQSLHCIAHLDTDIGKVIPYLNSKLGGSQYIKDPPSVTFKVHGKLITVHAQRIAINALKDEVEADRILEWLKGEINEVWERRDEIEPSFRGDVGPQILKILKALPRTNCRKCGQKTCMVFAHLVAEGAKGPEDCPDISDQGMKKLKAYLGQFNLDI